MDSSLPQPTQCSGIALLYPFLPPALRERGWWTNRVEATHPTAAAFIFYACTGRSATDYRELTFCLRVCGLTLSDAAGISPLSADDKTAAEHMLQTAITMAPALGNITPDSFRESFLTRWGNVLRSNNMPALYTEGRTYDLLLERLPWSINWIHLPWLQQPIAVYWGQLNTEKYNMEVSTNKAALLQQHADTLSSELNWMAEIIQMRLKNHLEAATEEGTFSTIAPPDVSGKEDSYARFITDNQLSAEERLILILALAPHLQPASLDILFTTNQTTGRPYSEFGGGANTNHKGFIPTIETALFLLAGSNITERLQAMLLLDYEHFFYSNHILIDEWLPETEPRGCQMLTLAPAVTDFLLFGTFSAEEESDATSASKTGKAGKGKNAAKKEKKAGKGKG